MDKLAEDNGERRRENESDGGGGVACCSRKFCWWNPPQGAVVSEFFNDTSLHGLKYIGQPRRHITERIFWFLVFVVGVVAAALLIYLMIMRYEDTPVVVSFKSKEQLIETIPFPAVTFCNINQFSKKKVHELQRLVNSPDENFEMAKRNLTLVSTFCQSQKSFARNHGFAFKRGDANVKDFRTYNEDQRDMLDFLVDNTVPCDQMIPLCMFEGQTHSECSETFKPVITEFGKCCTFNMMPLPLIYRNPSKKGKENVSIFNNPALGTRLHWKDEEIKHWKMWNYDKDFVMSLDTKPGADNFGPIRQHRAGKDYGLSVLIDPNTDDYYCPMTDSEGMIFTLHTAVELPNVIEFPAALDTNKEVFIKVYPDLTFADDDIRGLKSGKRHCYFENDDDKELKHYKPYTRENCIDDCAINYIAKKCDCASYYMPRDDGVRVCSIEVNSEDAVCVFNTTHELASLKNELCGHCLALCEDIEYKYETTMMSLQNATQIWHDMDPVHNKEAPEWSNHKVSIVHVFFGTPAIVPKLRKCLYGWTDLIANAGGILGLCLGFSVLSAAEVLYFALVRSLYKYFPQRRICGCCKNKVRCKPSSAVLQEQIKGAPMV